MMRRIAMVAFLVIGIRTAAGEPNGEATKEEIKKLRGIWQVTKFIDGSEEAAPADEIKGFTFEFHGDSVTMRLYKDQKGQPQNYIVNPLKKPKWIDIGVRKGAPLGQGIYNLAGDELTICVVGSTDSEKPTPRPAEFKASKKGHTLLVLKKVNK
jgi:uncharacterized protein (TIGR03067 family)